MLASCAEATRPGHVGALRHVGEARVEVGPRLAAVARHVDDAVVGAGVEHAGLLRRFDDLHEVAVRLHAVVLGDGEVLGDLAHERQRLAIGVLRQILADRLSTSARDRST